MKIAEKIMDREDIAPTSRLAAIAIILERAYGRPKQELDVTHRRLEEMTDEELYARLDELRAERARLIGGRDLPKREGDPTRRAE